MRFHLPPEIRNIVASPLKKGTFACETISYEVERQLFVETCFSRSEQQYHNRIILDNMMDNSIHPATTSFLFVVDRFLFLIIIDVSISFNSIILRLLCI